MSVKRACKVNNGGAEVIPLLNVPETKKLNNKPDSPRATTSTRKQPPNERKP